MAEINLMDVYPNSGRTWAYIKERSENVTPEKRAISRQFGRDYFDGDKEIGYGGYHYDGRWIPIAERLSQHYGLQAGSRILDIGCAKGFLVNDFLTALPGSEPFGIDISEYAVDNAPPSARERLCVGTARHLPYAADQFDLVFSVNALHYLDYDDCCDAIREIERVSRGNAFIMVNAWRTEGERLRVVTWDQITQTVLHVEEWRSMFEKAGYTGDYYWFFA